MRHLLRRHAAKLATGCVCLTLYGMALPRDLPAGERSALAARFQFEKLELFPAPNGQPLRSIREVHPSLQHVNAWVSAVGASVAIADVDGIGRPADICLVDPRNNSVTLMPAPGTGVRYEPIALPLPSEGYDPATIAPMGCLPADLNEDGQMDLVVYYWGRTPLAFLQAGEGTSTGPRFHPVEIVPTRERWFTNAALFVDVDGDGHPDLVFGNYYRDADRILDPRATDNVELQHSMSRAYNGGRNRLFLWQSAGPESVVFRDASDAFSADMANGWTLALGAADLTGDLLPEIYVANDFGPDRLLLNKSLPGKPAFLIVEGVRDFFTPRSKVLGRDSFKGMGVDFGDISGTGRFSIAVSNISETYGLLESHFLFMPTGDETAWSRGVAPYRDESVKRGTWTGGWAWDVKFADLDNSGVPQILQATGFIKGKTDRWPQLQELAMANDELLRYPASWPRFGRDDDLSGAHSHDRLFVADATGRYHDVWPMLGFGGATVSRAIAVGDVYGDGRLAVAIARQWMPSVFLRNTSVAVGHWLVLDLRLAGAVGGTRPAIGATARIKFPDGRTVVGQVDGGSGHSGRRAPEIHFGLGRGMIEQEINAEIAWRDAGGLHRMNVRLLIDRRHLIVLDASKAVQVEPIKSPR